MITKEKLKVGNVATGTDDVVSFLFDGTRVSVVRHGLVMFKLTPKVFNDASKRMATIKIWNIAKCYVWENGRAQHIEQKKFRDMVDAKAKEEIRENHKYNGKEVLDAVRRLLIVMTEALLELNKF